jgi:hypothetical protein
LKRSKYYVKVGIENAVEQDDTGNEPEDETRRKGDA